MLYRDHRDKTYSVIGYGCGCMLKNDLETNIALVEYAYQQGINYFDTAPNYGNSEKVIAYAFDCQKNRPIIASKSKAKTESTIRIQCETSLKKMNLAFIDDYYMWCFYGYKDFLSRKDALKGLEKLKKDGLIKNICASIHASVEDTKKILSEYPFDGVLLSHSILSNYRKESIDYAVSRDCKVAIMNPLAGGIIPRFAEKFNYIRNDDETVVESALRYLIDDNNITTVLVGIENKKDINEALSAVTGYEPLSKAQKKNIQKTNIKDICTNCGYCKCPQNIPVLKLMDSYNYYYFWQREKRAVVRARVYWGINLNEISCKECGKCESLCPQKLPIRERIKQLKKFANRNIFIKLLILLYEGIKHKWVNYILKNT